jgi:hypothetical protein
VARNEVNRIVRDKYAHVFDKGGNSREIMRYNFYLYQLDKTMKAQFVRMDKPEVELDLSGVNNFQPRNPSDPFSPLLVTPNLNIELSSFGETYEELMSLPNYPEFAEEFLVGAEKLYEAEGYAEETKVNNMITQLLLMDGYIDFDDLTKGRITEKVNRETIAAAKSAVLVELGRRTKGQSAKASAKEAPKDQSAPKKDSGKKGDTKK